MAAEVRVWLVSVDLTLAVPAAYILFVAGGRIFIVAGWAIRHLGNFN